MSGSELNGEKSLDISKGVITSIPKTKNCTNNNEKVYTVYHVVFSLGYMQHKIKQRFSKLREYHQKLTEFLKPEDREKLPEFAKRWRFSDMTLPDNINLRSEELIKYYNALWQLKEVLTCQRLHEMLQIPQAMSNAMIEMGDAMFAKEEMLKMEKAEEKRKEKIRRIQEKERIRREFEFSQNFHKGGLVTLPNGNKVAPFLNFSYDTTFTMKAKISCSPNDRYIMSPNGNPWFEIQILDPEKHQGCQFALVNLENEPLVYISEKFKFRSAELVVYRVLSIFKNNTGLYEACKLSKMCTVKREAGFFDNPKYGIIMANPLSDEIRISNSSNGEYEFFHEESENPVCTDKLHKEGFMSFSHVITVKHNHDVLFYLGVVIAIDRMRYHVTIQPTAKSQKMKRHNTVKF